jgi:hypothetical protein
MLRVSVTTIEKFRRYMVEESSFDSEEALIETLKGEFKGTDKTKFGHAYHKIIEGDYQYLGGKYAAEGIIFTKEQAVPAIRYQLLHENIINEIPVTKIYDTRFGQVQVNGRVDAIDGLRVRDAKTKFRSVDFKEYLTSSQWKFYLDMLDAETFLYDVFEVKGFSELKGTRAPFEIASTVRIIAHDPMECIRYPQMQQEISTLLSDFMNYIDNRNFFHLLKTANAEAIDF